MKSLLDGVLGFIIAVGLLIGLWYIFPDRFLVDFRIFTDSAFCHTKIEDARKNNEAILRKESLLKAEKNAAECQEALQKIKEDKILALKSSSLPEGFEITDEGIEYLKLPFNRKSLSTSAIYIGALKLASLGLGEVKTLHFDASSLDRESLIEVEKWASENNLQLLIEWPDRSGNEEIVYELIEEIK